MPKKKLTKAQIKRKYKSICNMFYDLLQDKLGHPDSHVGMSVNKLLEVHKACQVVWKKM